MNRISTYTVYGRCTCTCGAELHKGEEIVQLGRAKACRNCLDELLDAFAHDVIVKIKSNLFTYKAGAACHCASCGHTFHKGDLLAKVFAPQAYSECFCEECVKKARALLTIDPAKIGTEVIPNIEQLLLEARYGKDVARYFK